MLEASGVIHTGQPRLNWAVRVRQPPIRLVTERVNVIRSQRTPVDVRALAASAQAQRLVLMVVTGSPNRRSARWGKSARSQREKGRGSVATMISSNW